MCGRFNLRSPASRLMEMFQLTLFPPLEPRYNIAPSQSVVAIRAKAEPASNGDRNEAALLRWGLIPFWADDPKIGYKMINARAETIAEKPSFKQALLKRRCLVVADGFYEWKATGDKKQPYNIHLRDNTPFAMAGVWERWSKDGPVVESCAIITTSANRFMSQLHDRMPVILPPSRFGQWLDPRPAKAEDLTPLLQPCDDDLLDAYPVSTVVNNPRHDDEDCLAPQGPALATSG